MMSLPPPSEQDAEWAYRLWNTLIVQHEEEGIAGGVWDMPGVGRYRRTGMQEMTLTEVHGDMMSPDHLGVTLFDKHDWIVQLGHAVGWRVVTRVEVADTNTEPDAFEPALEDIGRAWVCPGCSLIYTLAPPTYESERYVTPEDGSCLNTNCEGHLLPLAHRGVLNVVDETAMLAKMAMEEQVRLMADEEDDLPGEVVESILGDEPLNFEPVGDSEE